jgi:hypothetical protein
MRFHVLAGRGKTAYKIDVNSVQLRMTRSSLNDCVQVKMKHVVSKEVYSARVNRWLSRIEDDFDVCREVALAPPGRQPLPGP